MNTKMLRAGLPAACLCLLLAACGGSSGSGSPASSSSSGGASSSSSSGASSSSGGSSSGGTAACASPTPAGTMNGSLVDNIPQDFDKTVNPAATTTVYFTVLLPPRCPGDTFPLVIHSHGYGESRLTTEAANGDLKSNDPMFAAIASELPQALPFHGYVVISFDERGHGESVPKNGGGYARIIDPAAETQDARAILDWAYDNATTLQLQTQPNSGIAKDLVVGSIGGSYGGGYQLPLAALDPRIDAIVPVGTWHDLLYSLLPGNSTKQGWDALLCLGATIGKVSNTPVVQTLCNQVGIQGPLAFNLRSRGDLAAAVSASSAKPRPVSENELVTFFNTHGMNYFQAQQQAGQPWGFGESSATLRPVPALFIQGGRDNLFNLTEAYWNYRYFSNAGGDVRLMSTEGGHMNPLANQTEGTGNCGATLGVNSALAWFDHYLKGLNTADFAAIPKICLMVDDTTGAPNVPSVGVTLNNFPVGSLSGSGAVPAKLATLSATLTDLTINPVFVPVTTISGSGQVLAGAATIGSLTVTRGAGALPTQSTNAFVGVGIVRGGKTILVHDEVTAFTQGTHTANDNVNEDPNILLPAVGAQLQDGDQVGLLFYPQHIQYAAVLSAVGLGGATGIVDELLGVSIPPITSALSPLLGLLYLDPYSVSATDVELPIFTPGVYAGSALSKPAS